MANELIALEVQALLALTVIVPVVTLLLKFTEIELPVALPEIVAPDGTVQVYEVAPVTDAIEYT
jgi:hypothetical protein